MRDEDERALVVLQRQLELLDRLEVEVVRRLVQDQRVRTLRGEQREDGAGSLSGESEDAGLVTWAPRSANFASSVRASPVASSTRSTKSSTSGR